MSSPTAVAAAPPLPPGYTLHPTAPTPTAYASLRLLSGLTPPTEAQSLACISGAWCAYHIVHDTTSTTVAMGRVISDGGWYFHIIDIATLPEHRQKGLAKLVVWSLMEKIKKEAPPGAYVNLVADPMGMPLYRKFGFVEGLGGTAMGLRLP